MSSRWVDLIWQAARAQRPEDGARKSRWVVIAPTVELAKEISKREDFEDLKIPPNLKLYGTEADGGRVQCELILVVVQKETDVKRLLSLEVTGAVFVGWALRMRSAVFQECLAKIMGRILRPKSAAGGVLFWDSSDE